MNSVRLLFNCKLFHALNYNNPYRLYCVQMFELNMHFIISVKVIFATYKNLIIPTMFELTKPCTLVFTHASKMLLHVFFSSQKCSPH